MTLTGNPVDGGVAVTPGPSSIQSRAHPINVETVCAVVARHMLAGVRRSRTMVLSPSGSMRL